MAVLGEETSQDEPVVAEVSKRVRSANAYGDEITVLVAKGQPIPDHLVEAYADGDEVEDHDPPDPVPEIERRGPDDPIVEPNDPNAQVQRLGDESADEPEPEPEPQQARRRRRR